jgi:ATP-dependent 26S proteasome regulatory subunit
MGDFLSSSSSLTNLPVVFLEVIPLVLIGKDAQQHGDEKPCLTNFGVKEYLRQVTEDAAMKSMFGNTSAMIHIRFWEEHTTFQDGKRRVYKGYLCKSTDPVESCSQRNGRFPVLYLPSEDPTVLDPIPCCVTAFVYRPHHCTSIAPVLVTVDTLVRMLPLTSAAASQTLDLTSLPPYAIQDAFLQDLLGEAGSDFLTESLQEEVLQNHNPETIKELALKMKTILSKSIQIGTTASAIRIQNEQMHQIKKMRQAMFAYCELKDTSAAASIIHHKDATSEPPQSGLNLWWPSLLVHSPNHGDGKTLLVQALAKTIGCSRIHMIRPSILLANYGSQADAALESRLHSLLVSAACHNQSVCIILDQIDMMMPPQLSGRSGAGDAALPIFNAVASYLRNVTNTIQRHQEFPFPIKNVLYNHGSDDRGSIGGSGGGGQVFSVNMCLVGIVTCPDDGWRAAQRSQGMGNGGSSILDCMVCDRYRIPLLVAQTRLSAFRAAFAQEKLILDPISIEHLPVAAASAAWAKGGDFQKIARHLKQLVSDNYEASSVRKVSLQDLESTLAFVKENSPEFAQVSFQVQQGSSKTRDGNSCFDNVGGNAKAKASLEDALALDPLKRHLLSHFGFSPPTGVLLYGPPGCGKTLLAKAVASLLKLPSLAGDSSSATIGGGTFVSLAISDVVSSEVGTSEKMIRSSFEFADKNAPSVIFLDEFQALFTDRSRGGSSRLTTTLLQCLDDIKRWYDADKGHENRVSVIAATNTPWMIDSAFLRPGRFDRVVHVGLPSIKERESILFLHINRMKLQRTDKTKGAKSLSKVLSKKTDGFSGADLAALCRAAAVRALFDSNDDTEVTELHFLQSLKTDVGPSSDDGLVQRLLQWKP